MDRCTDAQGNITKSDKRTSSKENWCGIKVKNIYSY